MNMLNSYEDFMFTGAVAAVLAVLIVFFLLAPHFGGELDDVREESSELSELRDKKERYLQMLNDLDLDYDTQKSGEADYAQTKNRLSSELSSLLLDLDHRDAERRS